MEELTLEEVEVFRVGTDSSVCDGILHRRNIKRIFVLSIHPQSKAAVKTMKISSKRVGAATFSAPFCP